MMLKRTQRRSFLVYYFNITNNLQLPNTVTINTHFWNRIVKLLMILFTSKNITRMKNLSSTGPLTSYFDKLSVSHHILQLFFFIHFNAFKISSHS